MHPFVRFTRRDCERTPLCILSDSCARLRGLRSRNERPSSVGFSIERRGKTSDMLLPHPPRIRLLEPTLLEWTLVEPACAEPHRWLGDHEHLQRAVELDPCDELARLKLVNSLVARVTWSTHELPYGYLGVAHEDFASLDEAEALLKGVSKEKDRVVWDAEITEQRELIAAYLRSKDDPKA